MKTKLISKNLLFMAISILIVSSFSEPLKGQTEYQSKRGNSVYLELGGCGLFISGNYEVKLQEDRDDGFGLRIGIGGMKIDFLGESTIIAIPMEVNYVSDIETFSFEVGYGITTAYLKEESWLVKEPAKTEFVILSYVPIGMRIKKPDYNSILLRLNFGPLINFSAPNLWSDSNIHLFFGLSIGYHFYTMAPPTK